MSQTSDDLWSIFKDPETGCYHAINEEGTAYRFGNYGAGIYAKAAESHRQRAALLQAIADAMEEDERGPTKGI